MPDGTEAQDISKRFSSLTPSTVMPVGMVVVIVLALWRGSAYLDDKFRRMEASINSVEQELRLVNMSIVDRWTAQDMKTWEQSLQIKNPTLLVPDSYVIINSRTRVRPVDRQ
jgi:hypothetical protein